MKSFIQAGVLVEERKRWKERREELVMENIWTYISALIFMRSSEERFWLILTSEKIPIEYQRAITLSVMGRSIHPYFGGERETKQHLEQCQLGLEPIRHSYIEASLLRMVEYFEICRLARLIIQLVGTRRQ